MISPTPPGCSEESLQGKHVDGWALYYEYFHKLNADMQQTSEASAQRRSCSVKMALPASDNSCFEAIAASLDKTDKKLVRIADAPDVAGGAAHDADGSRTLCEADLALVRAQLRAAAQSSNLHADYLAEAQEELLAETAHELPQLKGGAAAAQAAATERPADTHGTCAAAMETLLWFGLALGEPPRSNQQAEIIEQQQVQLERHQQEQAQRQAQLAAAGADEPLEMQALADLHEAFGSTVEFDWEQAASEAGLSDETADDLLGLGPLRSDFEAEAAPCKRQESADSSATCPAAEQFDSGSSVGDTSRTGSVCGDDAQSDGRSSPMPISSSDYCEPASPSSVDEGEASERAGQLPGYSSPSSADNRRVSARQPRPPAPWDKAVEAPLLKWEREALKKEKKGAAAAQQQQKGAAAKRQRSDDAPRRTPTGGRGRDDEGEDMYESDGGERELVSQFGLPATLLDAEPLMLNTDPHAKRSRLA